MPAGIPPSFNVLNWRLGNAKKPMKRKNKENTPKPSVISSEAFIEMEQEKIREQERQQQAAEDRKIEREKKAAAKEVEERLKQLRKIDRIKKQQEKAEEQLRRAKEKEEMIAGQPSLNSSATILTPSSIVNQLDPPSTRYPTPASSPTNAQSQSQLPPSPTFLHAQSPYHLYTPFHPSYTSPGFSPQSNLVPCSPHDDSRHFFSENTSQIQFCASPFPSPPFNNQMTSPEQTQYSPILSPCASPAANQSPLFRPF